jgi:hypothetical protein
LAIASATSAATCAAVLIVLFQTSVTAWVNPAIPLHVNVAEPPGCTAQLNSCDWKQNIPLMDGTPIPLHSTTFISVVSPEQAVVLYLAARQAAFAAAAELRTLCAVNMAGVLA